MNVSHSTKNQCNFGSDINVTVTDFTLTPLSCASLINEIIKNLLYQKAQIPYPYAWMKNIVTKKRRSLEEASANKQTNFTLHKYYQTVSSTYDALENIMTNMVNHFTHFSDNLKEVVFVFGVTPVCPFEVYTIRISTVARGHLEKNHVMENNRKQLKVLRDIFLSQNWMGLLDNSLSCTNTYVFLKICGSQGELTNLCGDSIFVPSKPLFMSPKVKHTVINLNYTNPPMCSCCDNVEVFEDSYDIESSRKIFTADADLNDVSKEFWLQSKVLVQGFKDCFINKISACELW